MTARDIRYGRRAGRWAPTPAPTTRRAPTGMTRCDRCDDLYLAQLPGTDKPGRCPNRLCEALDTWPAERWEEARRMAQARLDDGRTLTPLDRAALRHTTKATA